MKKLLVVLGVGLVGGFAIFIPASHEAALPFFAAAEQPVRILFVGDIMLDRNVAASAEERGVPYLFASTSALFADADARVANLEGTITTNPSIARQNNKILHFTFDPAIAQEALNFLHLTAVSQANNHAYDFGIEGYDSTRSYLNSWGVLPFGHPYNASSTLSTSFVVRGKSVCLVGYHALFDPKTSSVVKEIEELRPGCWKVVVFAHWGEEYQVRANEAQQTAAHAFVDAGADLVIGAHPHVVQNVELYNNKAIFYSLGNFMFDQNFSWATEHGLAVRVDFYDTQTRFLLTPTTIFEQKAAVAEGADKQKVLDAAGVADFELP